MEKHDCLSSFRWLSSRRMQQSRGGMRGSGQSRKLSRPAPQSNLAQKLIQKTQNPPERRADDFPLSCPLEGATSAFASTLPGWQVGMGVGPFLNVERTLAYCLAQMQIGRESGQVQDEVRVPQRFRVYLLQSRAPGLRRSIFPLLAVILNPRIVTIFNVHQDSQTLGRFPVSIEECCSKLIDRKRLILAICADFPPAIAHRGKITTLRRSPEWRDHFTCILENP